MHQFTGQLNRVHSAPWPSGLSKGSLLAVVVTVLGCLILGGCSGKEVDPLEYVKKELIPKVQDGLNLRDIAALKKLGTSRFEANRFIADVFSRGVRGDVSLAMERFRHVPGQVSLILNASFGVNGEGGRKELTLFLSDKTKKFKLDTYSLKDQMIPPPVREPNVFDSLPPEHTTPQDPS